MCVYIHLIINFPDTLIFLLTCELRVKNVLFTFNLHHFSSGWTMLKSSGLFAGLFLRSNYQIYLSIIIVLVFKSAFSPFRHIMSCIYMYSGTFAIQESVFQTMRFDVK